VKKGEEKAITDIERKKQEEKVRKKEWNKERRPGRIIEFSLKGIFWGGVSGLVLGFSTCMLSCSKHSTEGSSDPLDGIFYGAIIGLVVGIVVGLVDEE